MTETETIPRLLGHRRRHQPAMRALVADQESVTYSELDDRSADLARRLVEAGVARGDRVGLIAPNGIDWAVVAFAVTRIGAVLVPLSTLLRPPELVAQLQTADVTHLVTVASFRGRRYVDDLEDAAPGLRDALASGRRQADLPSLRAVWRMDGLPTGRASGAVISAMEQEVSRTDDLVVLFTSGSSGRPKGVIHTHGGALRAVAAGLDARCIHDGDRLYVPMPFFWTGGFAAGLLTTLVAGATLLTEAQPEPTTTLALLERERATHFRGWPDQAARLAADPAYGSFDLSSLTDASLPQILSPDRRPAPGARANLFGMTETFGPYSGFRADRDLPAGKHGSCGRPFDGIEVRIVDPETGAPAPPGTEGEIWVRGPNLMRGICGREHADVFEPDGSYRTGDGGHLDADAFLWYHGRLDDMFKVKGASVYPAEVESALRATPGVRQAFVIAVQPGDVAEVGAAVVTDRPVDAVAADLRARLSAFKLPTRWFVTTDPDRIPMLTSGKVDRTALARLILDDAT